MSRFRRNTTVSLWPILMVTLFQFAGSNVSFANQSGAELKILEACATIREMDESAPQWFDTIRGDLNERKENLTSYHSNSKFFNANISIVEQNNGNTFTSIVTEAGKTKESLVKSFTSLDKLLTTCFSSEISKSGKKGKSPFLSSTYLLSNDACVTMTSLFLGFGVINIQMWTPDSDPKACKDL